MQGLVNTLRLTAFLLGLLFTPSTAADANALTASATPGVVTQTKVIVFTGGLRG